MKLDLVFTIGDVNVDMGRWRRPWQRIWRRVLHRRIIMEASLGEQQMSLSRSELSTGGAIQARTSGVRSGEVGNDGHERAPDVRGLPKRGFRLA